MPTQTAVRGASPATFGQLTLGTVHEPRASTTHPEPAFGCTEYPPNAQSASPVTVGAGTDCALTAVAVMAGSPSPMTSAIALMIVFNLRMFPCSII